jgi:cytochrome P450 family 6
MSFALFELADNPDIQDKARDEVKRTLAKYGGQFTYESVFEMSYLNQVFNGEASSLARIMQTLTTP